MTVYPRWLPCVVVEEEGVILMARKMGKPEVDKAKMPSKSKKEKPIFSTKVVLRRLPPSLKEEDLKECLGSIPEHDFFYFVEGQMGFGPVLFSRAYINFKNPDDIIKFRDEFDGFVFTDERGQLYPAVVEYAPYQGIPKKKTRKDPKCNTIEQDKDYIAFLESLEKEVEPLPSIEAHLEELESRKENNEKKSTPLLEYLKMKRSSRGGSRLGLGKKRHEKDETPKTLKKNVPTSKDTKNTPREEKNKESKRTDNRDSGRRDPNRRDEDKKQGDDRKTSSDKDGKQQRNYKEREEKNRPDSSSRPSTRADDRRGNRRDRRDGPDSKGRDERGRRYGDKYSDADRRRDNRPSSSRDFQGSSKEETTGKGKDKEKEENTKTKKAETERKDQGTSRGAAERANREQEKRESEREKDPSRVKNKDRPDRAIYQPRPRGPRSDADQEKAKDNKPSPDKTRDAAPKEKDQDNLRKDNRERDARDKPRDRNRDRRVDRGRDKDRERDRDKADQRERDRERERERERARRKERDRRDRDRDRPPKEQKNTSEESVANKNDNGPAKKS